MAVDMSIGLIVVVIGFVNGINVGIVRKWVDVGCAYIG